MNALDVVAEQLGLACPQEPVERAAARILDALNRAVVGPFPPGPADTWDAYLDLPGDQQ